MGSPDAAVHVMPFGAEPRADGTVRFRLWAPAAKRIDLNLERDAENALLPMEATGAGWWQASPRASAGCRYRFRIDGDQEVPDPASHYQPADVHGPSEVVDPAAFDWGADEWTGRPWHEAVIYELHVGCFSPQGGFAGVEAKLDHLQALGITAIELMPVADFPGRRGWGYDGVFQFAPEAAYGRPEDLKRLVRAAHSRGLMVLLDVVYNHFGPEGNYLHLYAPQFFTERHATPWGAGLNFDGPGRGPVRAFFIHNALYWLEEYRLDGLRLDAVHAIADDSSPDILEELADAVAAGPGARRQVHLVLENDHNAAHYLERGYRAQWNDDLHHVLHLLISHESDGYYRDYADRPLHHLGRCLAEGFAYQGETSAFRNGARRGEPSAHLPPKAFVGFLQNHDQIGNRALGERIVELADEQAIRAATALLLLAPQVPLLFMGQEWGSRRRFPFFCDFGPELAEAVRAGRRREFARFEQFSDPAGLARIPDPQDPATFALACLDWAEIETVEGRRWLGLHRHLLALRRREIVPILPRIGPNAGRWRELDGQGLLVTWRQDGGGELVLLANLSDRPLAARPASGRCLFASHEADSSLPAWFIGWYLR